MNYINLTPENLDGEHICCAIADKKSAHAVTAKKAWLRQRISEGLVFRKADVRGKVFIEYIPAAKAWAPLEAPGWMYIHCLWVAGSYKRQGCGTDLLTYCINQTREMGMKGVVALTSARKLPFLTDKAFLLKHGFTLADQASPWFELVALPFSAATPLPRFGDSVHQPATARKGIDIWFTAQCPFATSYSAILQQWAEEHHHPVRLHHIITHREATLHASPYTSFSLFIDGQFVSHEIPTPAKLEAMMAGS